MDYRNVKLTAEAWKVSDRRVTLLARDGRIPGAVKEGRKWLIPVDAVKPEDLRTSDGVIQQKSIASRDSAGKCPLPVGVSDYAEAVKNFYCVDKTLMIKDILDYRTPVTLFTRPRRFGKTLNMDMIRVFFEKTEDNTSVYFHDKKIWKCGEKYQQHQGKYPVIFVTFKDVKYPTWEETQKDIAEILSREFLRHGELKDSTRCTDIEKEYYHKIVSGISTNNEMARAFSNLTLMLHKHHGVAPIIIIDEYDTPIQQGYMQGFYDQVVSFMRNLFSGGLKDNRHLSFGFLTGILRVAKESIFSGLNNLKVNSIMENRYSQYFGFTHEEVKEMLQYYGRPEKYNELCEWYNGYRFGDTEIFNPWSVINYMDENCIPKAFWQSTGSNRIINTILSEASDEMKENLQLLMQGKSFMAIVDTAVIYPEIKKNPFTVYSFLLVAGYLKVAGVRPLYDGNTLCEIAIPNKEIYYVYQKEILTILSRTMSESTAISIQQAILLQDISELQKHLQDYLTQTISYYDTSTESFYHGLMLGLYAIMNNLYKVTSNRESGNGRFDIQMEPLDPQMPGILVELKVLRDVDGASKPTASTLKELSQKALNQIDEKEYTAEMQNNGIDKMMKLGIAFYKKQVEISSEIS